MPAKKVAGLPDYMEKEAKLPQWCINHNPRLMQKQSQQATNVPVQKANQLVTQTTNQKTEKPINSVTQINGTSANTQMISSYQMTYKTIKVG